MVGTRLLTGSVILFGLNVANQEEITYWTNAESAYKLGESEKRKVAEICEIVLVGVYVFFCSS